MSEAVTLGLQDLILTTVSSPDTGGSVATMQMTILWTTGSLSVDTKFFEIVFPAEYYVPVQTFVCSIDAGSGFLSQPACTLTATNTLLLDISSRSPTTSSLTFSVSINNPLVETGPFKFTITPVAYI
jgi:hypothetical protein